MSEGRNYGREIPFKDIEKIEEVGYVKLEDLKNTPWQDITEDLAAFSDPEVVKDPNGHQVFINNETAKHAVEEGWLIVKKVSEGKYEAFTTTDWEEEKGRMKRAELEAKELDLKYKQSLKKGNGNGNGHGNGNGKEAKKAAMAAPLIKLLEDSREGGLYDLSGDGEFWELEIFRKKDQKSTRKSDGKKIQNKSQVTFKGTIDSIMKQFIELFGKPDKT